MLKRLVSLFVGVMSVPNLIPGGREISLKPTRTLHRTAVRESSVLQAKNIMKQQSINSAAEV